MTKQKPDKPHELPPSELLETAANVSSTKSYYLSKKQSHDKIRRQDQVPRVQIRSAYMTKQKPNKP